MRKKPAAQGRGHQAMVTPIITPLNRGVDNEKKVCSREGAKARKYGACRRRAASAKISHWW
jgi:hypothetical protein